MQTDFGLCYLEEVQVMDGHTDEQTFVIIVSFATKKSLKIKYKFNSLYSKYYIRIGLK